jgi:hypothetical protein
VQELAAVTRARFREDSAALAAWREPLQRPVKHESAVKVIRRLEELQSELAEGSPARETVTREGADLREHQSRMDQRDTQRRDEPLGRGAVEATGAQDQCAGSGGPGSFGVRPGTRP